MSVQLSAEGHAVAGAAYHFPEAFKRRKSLPRSAPTSDPYYNESVRHASMPNNALLDAQRTRTYMPGGAVLDTNESSSPPTPLPHLGGQSSDRLNRPSPPSADGTQLIIRKRQERSLSRDSRGGLITTPQASPSLSDHLSPPSYDGLGALSPASRADSFKTAREEPWSSEDEGEISPLTSQTNGPVGSEPQASHPGRLETGFERDGDSTPTPKKLERTASQQHTIPQLDGTTEYDVEVIPDREWDTNLMRNITVRRKRRPVVTHKKTEEDEERIVAREIVPKLGNGSSEDEETLEPITPSRDQFRQVVSLPRAHKNDESIKRLSSSSHNSTVIEAMIVPTSPQRRRTLRHVSKNLSLRSSSGSSSTLLLASASDEASLTSDDLSMRQLNAKLRAEDMSRANGLNTPEIPSMLPTNVLRHHADRYSLRADSINQHSRRRESASASPKINTVLPQRRAFSGSDVAPTSRNSTSMSLPKSPLRGEPANVKYDTNSKPQRSNSTNSWRDENTRAATRRALRQVDSMTSADLEPKSSSSVHEILAAPVAVVQPPTPQEEVPLANDFDRTPDLALIQTRTKDSIDALSSLQPHSTLDSVPRVSFDRSTLATHDMHRASLASSSLHPDSEHANARHLYAQSTPFSQTSESHEISEATTVSLFPHNNTSVLVVQQIGRSSAIERQPFAKEDEESHFDQPTLFIQPATPPQKLSTPVNVDSPLRNPRRPPQPPQQNAMLLPPVIHILPATPDHEREGLDLYEQPGSRNSEPLAPPTQSLSIIARARRYSDSVMRPIITRTSSLRRSYYRTARRPRQNAPRAHDSKRQVSNLHPFWQPRGFWDDFSDSDSESDDAGGSRLPAGGDTSDLGEPRGIRKVVETLVSRHDRGFLIGNSLGLERVDSNVRRPIIELPVGLGRRASSRVLHRTSSQSSIRAVGSGSSSATTRNLRTANAMARQSMESLRRKKSGANRQSWNPRNWQVQYVGVDGLRCLWNERKAEKRRQELKSKIGVRYSVENAPVAN